MKKSNYAYFLDVELEDATRAEPHYLEALDIAQNTFGQKHPVYLEMLFDVGSYYAYYEEHLKAIPYFQEGIATLEQVVRTQYAQLDETSRNKYIELLMLSLIHI